MLYESLTSHGNKSRNWYNWQTDINETPLKQKQTRKLAVKKFLVRRRVITSVDERRSCDIVSIAKRHNK